MRQDTGNYRFSQSVVSRLIATPWTAARKGSLACCSPLETMTVSKNFFWASMFISKWLGGFEGNKKTPPANQETRVRSLGWDDPLEKEMATHFSILAWRLPWTEEPGGRLQSMRSHKVGHGLETKQHYQHNSFYRGCLTF